jgi:hypothetical protein
MHQTGKLKVRRQVLDAVIDSHVAVVVNVWVTLLQLAVMEYMLIKRVLHLVCSNVVSKI